MNPEFQRNLWLEASPRRLAWAGVVLLLIYGATVMATRTNPYGPLPVLGGVGAAVFVACLFGPYMISVILGGLGLMCYLSKHV